MYGGTNQSLKGSLHSIFGSRYFGPLCQGTGQWKEERIEEYRYLSYEGKKGFQGS